MSIVEIGLIVLIGSFMVFSVLKLLGVDFKKLFKAKEKEPKPKKEKVKKEKKAPAVSEKKEQPQAKADEKPQAKDETGFKITKKGVARIQKKALDRDSRSLAKIEPAIKRDQNGGQSYESFDDLLSKMKSVGDPDELDDETFRKMFLSGMDAPQMSTEAGEEPMSSDFESLESPSVGKINRRLEHFTIDGVHLSPEKNVEGLPARRPMIRETFEFTPRITGRYDNIATGDISNRLAPSEEQVKKEEAAKEAQKESDEDIFAKIMERRRRELGLEPMGKPSESEDNSNGEVVITPETLVIAEAILNRKGKKVNL